MNSKPKTPYYRECNSCYSHDIRMMTDSSGKCVYEYCGSPDCETRHDSLGGFLVGPGIISSVSAKKRLEIYQFYFGDCCCICGNKDAKVCGYTQGGEGIPFRVCKKHASPVLMPEYRALYSVKPRSSDHFDRAAREKTRQREIAEKKKNIAKMGIKRPVIGRTGKTQRKRESKV